jgi:molecular chaperone DnaJ
MRKSHYTILGIPRGETSKGVRAAYLRLVKALHPDRAGEGSTNAFREVQHAYDVLSDPARRKSYDETLDPKRPAQAWQAEALTRHHRVEPLVPDKPLASRGNAGWRPLLDDWLEAMMAAVSPIGAYSHPPTRIDFDLVLSPGQAERGGDFTLSVPVERSCRRCAGTGVDGRYPCPACRQRGVIVREQVLRLRIPAGVRQGTVIDLQPGHSDGMTLRVRLLVDRRMRAPPYR